MPILGAKSSPYSGLAQTHEKKIRCLVCRQSASFAYLDNDPAIGSERKKLPKILEAP